MRQHRLRWQLAALLLWMLYKRAAARKNILPFPLASALWNGREHPVFFDSEVVHLTEHFSNASQEALFQSNLLLQIIGIGVFVPFVEELVFRGLVYGKMRRLFLSWWAAAAVSAGFLHFIMETSFSWFMPFPWAFFWPGPTNAGEVFQRRCSFTSEPIFLEFWRR